MSLKSIDIRTSFTERYLHIPIPPVIHRNHRIATMEFLPACIL